MANVSLQLVNNRLVAIKASIANEVVPTNRDHQVAINRSYYTFLIRRAPEQSAIAGTVACEIHCPPSFIVSTMLASLKVPVKVLETKETGWKLLRFTCSHANALKLAHALNEPTNAAVASETRYWLQAKCYELVGRKIELVEV